MAFMAIWPMGYKTLFYGLHGIMAYGTYGCGLMGAIDYWCRVLSS
jgi:hypothetical protein